MNEENDISVELTILSIIVGFVIAGLIISVLEKTLLFFILPLIFSTMIIGFWIYLLIQENKNE